MKTFRIAGALGLEHDPAGELIEGNYRGASIGCQLILSRAPAIITGHIL